MFDTEKFIYEIEIRPPLYDINSIDFLNRKLKYNLWLEVGQEVVSHWADLDSEEKNSAVKDLMKKWRNIKDCYIKQVKAETKAVLGHPVAKKKRYKYYDILSFLHTSTIDSYELQRTVLSSVTESMKVNDETKLEPGNCEETTNKINFEVSQVAEIMASQTTKINETRNKVE